MGGPWAKLGSRSRKLPPASSRCGVPMHALLQFGHVFSGLITVPMQATPTRACRVAALLMSAWSVSGCTMTWPLSLVMWRAGSAPLVLNKSMSAR